MTLDYVSDDEDVMKMLWYFQQVLYVLAHYMQ